MTVVAAFCPLSTSTLRDRNDCPVRGGSIYVYDADTTSARTVYQDKAMTTAFPTPIKTNGYGRIPQIWIGLGDYKLVLQDRDGSQLEVIDDLPGGQDVEDAVQSPSGFAVGDLKIAHTDDQQDGWLWSNGQTIGNENSAATARANADCEALFKKLWNKDSTLVVGNGRGLSADDDWTASKTITLPDWRGRVPIGCDQMGAATAAGRITTATTPTPDKVGTFFGIEQDVLSVAQLPTVTPTVAIANAGSHAHTGTTSTTGSHNHGGSTDTTGAHSHLYTATNNSNAGTASGSGGQNVNQGVVSAGTAANGAHSHSISADGAHAHTLNVDAAGDHTHTGTVSPFGSGAKHSKMQPSGLVYVHIKL